MQAFDEHTENSNVVMDPDDAAEILKAVSQEYTGEMTSLTQYSAVYNNARPGMDIYIYPDYTESYHFDL